MQTALLFALIHALIYGNALRQIRLANPIALLGSERAGEKPPKANWLPALLGVALLGTAYYLAVSIQDPVAALVVFFFAVVMVVAATYLLFISGSVTLCRLLQKNRRYYYKTNHFVSVSSMAYRMKPQRGGARVDLHPVHDGARHGVVDRVPVLWGDGQPPHPLCAAVQPRRHRGHPGGAAVRLDAGRARRGGGHGRGARPGGGERTGLPRGGVRRAAARRAARDGRQHGRHRGHVAGVPRAARRL